MEKKKIEVTCEDCGEKFYLLESTIKRQPKNHIQRCKKCRVAHQKLWFKNMTQEQQRECYEKMSNSAKNRWENMSPKEYEEYCKKLSKADRLYWDNISPEEYKMRCEAAQTMWDNLTVEQRMQHIKNISKSQKRVWNNLSEEEYNKRCEILYHSAVKYWSTITPDEMERRRQMTSLRFKKYWSEMTPEEFLRWKKHQVCGFESYLSSLNLYPNKNERDVINLFNKYNIKFTRQYVNDTVDPSFDEYFPKHIIPGAKFINPYHKWDFLVYNDNLGPILVDVDGSIHDPSKNQYTVTYYTGDKFILGDYIDFNDHQRPFQTDGLPAYIIKTYDDNINLSCDVLNLLTGKTITLEEFLEIIK